MEGYRPHGRAMETRSGARIRGCHISDKPHPPTPQKAKSHRGRYLGAKPKKKKETPKKREVGMLTYLPPNWVDQRKKHTQTTVSPRRISTQRPVLMNLGQEYTPLVGSVPPKHVFSDARLEVPSRTCKGSCKSSLEESYFDPSP